ncbi:MAG: TlpA family protein disulfide reductase [Saprospiraceae bacterium]|nr:TlpA family protein disulfide reductase [Saprospiraceae bacterium]
MYKYILILSTNWLFSVSSINAQDIRVFDTFDKMEKEIFLNNDTTYVINFWATWCKPCVKELPYFESLHRSARKEKMKVILISLDFRNQAESKLKPFIRDNHYSAEVILLLDNKYNSWIDKVDKSWSGSIPSTLLIKGGKRLFAETEFENEQELRDFVYSFINSH